MSRSLGRSVDIPDGYHTVGVERKGLPKREKRMPSGQCVGLLKKGAGELAQLERAKRAAKARRLQEIDEFLKSK